MSMTQGADFREFARAVGVVMDFAPGDAIFREGDEPKNMYLVLAGTVEVAARGRVLETVGVGQALGIVSLLDDLPRTATATARTHATLAIIDRRKFRYMAEEMPGFCWYVMGELAHRLRMTNSAL